MLRLTGHMIRYPPGLRMRPHADGCRRLSVLVSGGQEEEHRRTSVRATFGSVALKDPDIVHRNQFGEAGATIVSVLLPDETVAAFGCRPDTLALWQWYACGPASLAGLRLAVGLRQRDGARVEECLVELLSSFVPGGRPEAGPPPERLRRIRDRLHEEPDWVPSVRRLAAAEGLHPVSLGRAFQRTFGCSITRYRQKVRAAAVAHDLVAGGRALVEVALEHGYADSSHMTRVFHRELGMPPAAFQAQMVGRDAGLESFKTEWFVDV